MMYLVLYSASRDFMNLRIANDIKRLYQRWAVVTDNAFIIITDQTAVEVRNILQSHIGSKGKLLVTHITSPAAWLGLSKEVSDWIFNAYTIEKNNK